MWAGMAIGRSWRYSRFKPGRSVCQETYSTSMETRALGKDRVSATELNICKQRKDHSSISDKS